MGTCRQGQGEALLCISNGPHNQEVNLEARQCFLCFCQVSSSLLDWIGGICASDIELFLVSIKGQQRHDSLTWEMMWIHTKSSRLNWTWTKKLDDYFIHMSQPTDLDDSIGVNWFFHQFVILNAGVVEPRVFIPSLIYIVSSYGQQVFYKQCIHTWGPSYSKHACREHNTCKSCTHVEESNPSMMHDKFRPLRFPWQRAPAQPSWIDFNRRLTKMMWLPPGQHDGANNNLYRPRGSDVATYPLVCLVLCVPNEIHQITDANAAGPLIKTISARWHSLRRQ